MHAHYGTSMMLLIYLAHTLPNDKWGTMGGGGGERNVGGDEKGAKAPKPPAPLDPITTNPANKAATKAVKLVATKCA